MRQVDKAQLGLFNSLKKQPMQMGDMGKGDPRLGTELPSATVPGTNPDLTSLGVPRLGTERGCRGSRI